VTPPHYFTSPPIFPSYLVPKAVQHFDHPAQGCSVPSFIPTTAGSYWGWGKEACY